jgi:hypothetical protein
MKKPESILAILLCTGLIVTFGLTACGDDDEVDCVGVLAQLQASACENATIAAIDVFRGCMTACAGNQVCEDGCENVFNTATSACEPAATILTEECGCQVCGNNFEGCIAGQDPAADCIDNILDCFVTCVS